MSCPHPYSAIFQQKVFSSRLIFGFRLCLVLLLLSFRAAKSQNTNLFFPVFNDTDFTCSGLPVVQKDYCEFQTQFADLLPSTYNSVYSDQAGRMMYKTPIMFWTVDNSSMADFSTFIIFSVSHVQDHPMLGGGIAFLVAPELDTPTSSAGGSFGMLSYDYTTKLPVSGEIPMVVAIEFDTALTPGIDTVPVPHIGLDINSVTSSVTAPLNSSSKGNSSFLDQPVAMWVDYNASLKVINVYIVPVSAAVTDADSAASLKPSTPLLTANNFSLSTIIQRESYIGISAGTISGQWEDNKIFFWSFQTFGLPPLSLIAAWYQWFDNLSASKKVGIIVGGVIGTVAGAYVCSECLFFCFFKRIKKPVTEAEKRWPVRRRKTLPGLKEPPPKKKIRDSLSVASPLDLWGTPLEPETGPHVDVAQSAAKDAPKNGAATDGAHSDSSDDEKKKPAADVEGPEISEEAPAKEPAKKPSKPTVERKVAFDKPQPNSPAKPAVKKVSPLEGNQKAAPSQAPVKKAPPKRPPTSSPKTSPKAGSSPRAGPRAAPPAQTK